MSWFKERAAYAEHMKYRECNPGRYVGKHGTNKHSDHSKVLSNDLAINQRLVDTLFFQIMSLIPSKNLSLPLSIEIRFGTHWVEHCDNDSSVIGVLLPYQLSQYGKVLREGRMILANWGNRGEPASVYEDAFSRFIIFEVKKQNSTTAFDGLTQYGFHKFLNAKYCKLLPQYKILGIKKEIKPKILHKLESNFGLKVSNDSVILPEVEIKEGNDDVLLDFIKQLFIIGFVKEFYRGRIAELLIDAE